jgi:hypothetical protein
MDVNRGNMATLFSSALSLTVKEIMAERFFLS